MYEQRGSGGSGDGRGALTPALLLLVAFAAGYSERLAPQAVERVSGITGRSAAV